MATPVIRYAQNVAIEQIPFANFPGGGPIAGPSSQAGFPSQFNDPALEIGEVFEVTAIYQMYGNEAASDVINIYLAQPNTVVAPTGSVSGSGVATTATLNVGDDDVTGYGLVSSGAAFETTQLSYPAKGASPTRYAANINVATGQTNPVAFAGGDALVDPYVIGTLAVEPVGGSAGTGVAGSWVQATFVTMATPVAGKVLVFRLRVIKP